MNKRNLTSMAIALTVGIAPQLALGAKKSNTNSYVKSGMSSTAQVTRVSEDRIDQLTTAKDLIGSSVYDSNGDKIGDIADVSFGRNLMASTESRSNWGSDSATSMNDSKSNKQDSSMQDKQSNWNDSDKDRNQNDSDSAWGRDDSNNGNNNDALARSDSQNRKQRKDKMDSQSHQGDFGHLMSSRPETVVFLSVGGVFGIGDDLVQVPASKISYDSQNERFVLKGHTVDQVASIAESDTDYTFNEEDYYTDDWYSAYGYGFGSNAGESTTRAKRQYQNDKDMVRDAFDHDVDLKGISEDITILQKEGKIILTGNVDDWETKQRAEEVARQQTSLLVENRLKIESDY